jgi:hypothetical protein
MRPEEQIRLFAMSNLQLESDLARLEASGLEIAHARTLRRDEIVDLELFEADLRRQARRMADFYVLYYCLENSIRRLIKGRLESKFGVNWWESSVPDEIRRQVAEKQGREKESVMEIRSDDPLLYTNFGELVVILDKNWDLFSDTIRSKKAMQQTLGQFNLIRNVIAHSCELVDNDIMRLKLLVNDWLNIQT